MLTMTHEEITLEKIYHFMVLFKHETDLKLTSIENRLDHLEYRLERLEERVDRLEDKMEQLWETRDKMKLEFNRRVLLGNSFLAGLVAFFVAMFTGKYKPY